MSQSAPMLREELSSHALANNSRSSSPSYLYLKGNLYYFRVVLPKNLREGMGRKEFRFSLRTPHRRKARIRAMALFTELYFMFAHLSEENMLSLQAIRRRMNILLQRLLEQDHRDLSQRHELPLPDGQVLSLERWLALRPES